MIKETLMRMTRLAAAAAASLLLSAPALARGFEVLSSNDVLAGPIGAVEVRVSEDIIENQRRTQRSVNFRNETIGPRDAEQVSDVVRAAIERRLQRADQFAPDAAGASTLVVTLTKVRATNLQFTEYGQYNNLGFGSVARGGADFDAELLNADGETVARYAYDYYNTDGGSFALRPTTTWYDARRAAGFFAGHVAKRQARPAS
ncbi:MAG: hypothetical protein MI723_12835 [Caulobacterales bacterium]|nr:hypothetical protein [Caulobacterales bacterium]